MKKILCFGEILLRLSPDVSGNWLKSCEMPVYLGGAELNVANALAKWNMPVAYCSGLPENYMSVAIRRQLENNGVDVSTMISGGKRIGIYYLAQGTDLKHAEVIYDRAGSSTAELQVGQVDWDKILHGVSWFHFSAISPAISPNLAAVCKEALDAAKRHGLTISVDLNYRSKLWKWGKQPAEVMPGLVEYCNVIMGNLWAAELMLGVALDKNLGKEKASYLEQSEKSSRKIVEKYPACKLVGNTFRFDKGDSLQYYGTAYVNNKLYVSKEYELKEVVDRVGSGDCFMAGLIYGTQKIFDEQQLIEFAAAAAVDKMFVMGDATTSSVEQVLETMKAGGRKKSTKI